MQPSILNEKGKEEKRILGNFYQYTTKRHIVSAYYQIAKLTMIPVSCLLEVVFDKIRYSRDTKLSILVVLLGVAVCTVTDVSVNTKGFVAAFIAVWSTSLQQYVSYIDILTCFKYKHGF